MALTDHVRLTTPQLRVLAHLAAGQSYQAIAEELHLSCATIAFHAARLQKRLGVSNNTALVAIAFITGLLTTDIWPPQLSGRIDIDPRYLDRAAEPARSYPALIPQRR